MSTDVRVPVQDVRRERASGPKRKRSPAGSRSPQRSMSPPRNRRRPPFPHRGRPPLPSPELPQVNDVDPVRRRERERQLALKLAEDTLEGRTDEKEKPEFDAKAEFAKLVSTKSGGVYMPPARLRALQAKAAEDKSSPEYQRLLWDALRKSLTGIVNRVDITNIKNVIPELFNENLILGRGLFARSLMKAQAASLPYTPVFAAVVAIVNAKLPQVGELIVHRVLSQYRRAFKRMDKTVCVATATFIAHLVNQAVIPEIVALEIVSHLLEEPTDDGVEIAVGFMREVGAFLLENSPRSNDSVFARFRAILQEDKKISKRVLYMIEVLFQVLRDKYKDNPIFPEGLDLVQEEDQITHQISLNDDLQVQESLNIFKFDPNFLENEERYKQMKNEILGSDGESGESGSESDDEDESDEEAAPDKEGIEDKTGTNLVNLRRVIYLTIMNSLNYEEAVHKLMKVDLQEGQEIELCNMIIECCSQERTYSKFYGLVGERFCRLNRVWCENFEEAFANYYDTIHRYETNRLRNIARFFGHLLSSDAISWALLSVVRMNEDDTTSSSRIFVKILMQEMNESMGLEKLADRFKDPSLQEHFTQLFPMDNPKNTRFSINYFTSIGLGVVTEAMREHLQNAPKLIMAQRHMTLGRNGSYYSSSSYGSDDYTSDSDLSRYSLGSRLSRYSGRSYGSRRSLSRSRYGYGRGWRRGRRYYRSRSPYNHGRSYSRSGSRYGSYSRSYSPGGRRYHSRSRSPSVVVAVEGPRRSRSWSRSHSPYHRRNAYSRSRSPSVMVAPMSVHDPVSPPLSAAYLDDRPYDPYRTDPYRRDYVRGYSPVREPLPYRTY
ncbi:uncharacterized protein EI90DRAFT_3063826 [Cantharellus anzutake]|uniref:uncharacterized protein n=1 Tax=Cantharellus anzutake TaxID=1750568 RepID=UPI0019045F19|nr:uncharacterized protein EI90DRAFT_3063826 [Cantharellus anzutake]KAF8328865.1 hypothetical protein EI90DRAFT_3063826 [Cantharellus anzutake]